MLWSKSFVQADSMCPKQSVKLRLGHKGTPWEGFKVGSYVHHMVSQYYILGKMPDSSAASQAYRLSVEEMVSAQKLLNNFEEMGIELPNDAAIEQPYYSEILEGGVPNEWKLCPPWMDRDSGKWEPAKAKGKTIWRFQPDAYYLSEDGSKITCVDWKTGWGLPSNSSLTSDIQAITYCAALCEMFPDAESAEFVWWNLRWKKGQSISRSSLEWADLAKPIFNSVWLKDRFQTDAIQKDERAGEHCGRCPYSSECLAESPDYQKYDDIELYKYSQKISALSRLVKSDLSKRLKQRTSTVDLESGVRLGPAIKHYRKWKKGGKPKAIQRILECIPEGMSLTDVVDIQGSVNEWFSKLPENLKQDIEQHTEMTSRQVYVEKEK